MQYICIYVIYIFKLIIIVSEPVTEERFLTYFKCLNTKLNHIINLLKDRCTEMLVDEAENLLPNFPLRTVQEFEQFQENLVTSLEIQKLYVSRSFIILSFTMRKL